MNNNKGFTLIELLVVISIIGVISSIVLVSFSGSRDKARLAKAQQFDAQISHALGAYAVGIWRFEEGSGGSAKDESGYGRNGTICGAVSDIGIFNKCLRFDGSNDHVYIASNPFEYRGEDITISVWANPDSAETTGGYIISKPWNGSGQYNYGIIYNSNKTISFSLYGSSGWSTNVTKKLSTDTWHHIAVTVGSDKKVKIYLDGKNRKDTTHNISAWVPSAGDSNRPLSIGTLYSYGCAWGGHSGHAFDGMIDDVRIYNEALSSAQIQQHYAAGAPSHGIAVNKK